MGDRLFRVAIMGVTPDEGDGFGHVIAFAMPDHGVARTRRTKIIDS